MQFFIAIGDRYLPSCVCGRADAGMWVGEREGEGSAERKSKTPQVPQHMQTDDFVVTFSWTRHRAIVFAWGSDVTMYNNIICLLIFLVFVEWRSKVCFLLLSCRVLRVQTALWEKQALKAPRWVFNEATPIEKHQCTSIVQKNISLHCTVAA